MSSVELRVPGDKSIAHRALVLASLADGVSRVGNATDGADVASTEAALRALGARIARSGAEWRIDGAARSLRGRDVRLDCGNSGTTARLLIGVCAALDGPVFLDGDASLRRRPMERIAAPLRHAGAHIECTGAAGTLPVRVEGAELSPIRHRSEVASAQVKSALLLAGLVAGVDVIIQEPMASRDHTERMLRAMGADLRAEEGLLRLVPGAPLQPLETSLPGDFSSAAFFIAAALVADTPVVIREVGVNPTRTGFLDIARRMGAVIDLENRHERGGEPIADLIVTPGALRGVDVAGSEVVRAIDELPLVAILGVHAAGETRVRDAAELRAKESDRIAALCANLDVLGLSHEERPDGFSIEGMDTPRTGRVRSFGDHRIAMSFAVLGLRPGAGIEVDDLDIARISFPGFAAQLERIRAARPAATGGFG